MDGGTLKIVTQMGMLFLLIALGYGCKKLHMTNDSVDKGLSKITLNIAMPALILSAVLTAENVPSLEDILLTFVIAIVMQLFLVALAYGVSLLLRVPDGFKGAYRFMLVFGNVGFLGFPVIAAIFGPDALIYTSIFQVPFNIILYIIGPILVTQDREDAVPERVTLKTFLTPMVLVCVVSVILVIVGVRNVPFVAETFTLLGNMATPAAMIVIGSQLGNMPFRDMLGGPRLWLMSAFRLMVNPLIVWLVFGLFVQNQLLMGILVVTSAMPVANVGVMFSLLYGVDTKTLSQGIFVSTLLSIATIPLLLVVMGA